MKAQKDLERKIEQKEREVQDLREQLLRAEAYVDAYKESLRLIQRTVDSNGGEKIRPGSKVFKAREALRQAGKPLHVEALLRSMGEEVTRNTKISLSGSLGFYVREGSVFTRPAPNTFGLIEFNEAKEDEIPEGFGTEGY